MGFKLFEEIMRAEQQKATPFFYFRTDDTEVSLKLMAPTFGEQKEFVSRVLRFRKGSTVEDLRRAVERDWAGIPEAKQLLVHDGKELTTGTLDDCGVKSGATVFVIERRTR